MKPCKRCGKPVPIARVLSICDTCLQQARQAMKDTARGIN